MNRSFARISPWLFSSLLFFAPLGKPFLAHAQTFSSRSGWGSIPYSGGCTFRVWAPNASKVTVAGDFNSWSTTTNPLVHDPVYTQGTSWVWSVDVPGAMTNQQYKYYLNGSFYRQDPRARNVVSVSGNCIIYNTTNFNWAGDNFTAPGLSNTVIYEMCIGSFNDPYAPSSPGTFYTATNTLPYLQQLGITAVEVMPINQFGCCYSWGYNPADIFAVDNDAYGGPDAFKTFVKTAHQLGLAVLLDTCQNHYGGTDTETYGDLIYGLWRFDGTGTSQSGTNYGGIYFYGPPNCLGFAQTWGPRPNYNTPQVYQFIVDNISMWLNEYHVDGFRWDSPGEIVNDWPCSDNDNWTYGSMLVTNCAYMVHTAPGHKINIGEDQNEFTGTYGFDATWDDNTFFDNVQPALISGSDATRAQDVGSISYAVNINTDGGGLGGWGSVVFMEDHDQCGGAFSGANRLPVDIDSSDPTGYYARKRDMLGSAITLTTAGLPMLLQGEEFLTTNNFGANIALNWSLTNTYSGIVSYYTDLISLRRNLTGLTSGLQGLNTQTIWTDTHTNTPMIAYRRYNTGSVGDDVIVICNLANTNLPAYTISGFPHNGTWYTQLNSDWTTFCSDYGNYGSTSVTVSGGTGTFAIAPYSVLILSQNIPGAPPTPQALSVTSVTTNQIGLAWNVSSTATGYIVNRNGSPIATTSTNVYSDTGLATGVQYCYSVNATNNLGGVSAGSATVCATTIPVTTATNLLAWWTFDEGTGSFAYDYSGNTNTGTVIIGDGYWTSGMVSNCLYFAGEYGPPYTQVTVSNSTSLNPAIGITLAAWVYDQSGGWFNTPRIIEKGASDNQYALFVNSSGSLEFLLAGVTNITVSPPSSGFWHHLAAAYDGSSLMSLYIDGQLATQQLAGGAMPIVTDSLAIGNKPGSSSPLNFFTGYIDDVRIYGSALTPSAISALYNIDSVGDGIPNWWRLQFFGSSSATNNTSCATCDADGTGQDNYFKFVADLCPTDSTVFVLQIAASNQWINLTFWPAYPNPNLTYTALSSTDLVHYSSITNSALSVSGITNTITDFSPWPTNEFYRIQITNPTAPSN
jgi:1,4-alpha-glucan branching enzyme